MNEYHKKLEAESAGKAYQIPAENATTILFPSSMMSGFLFKSVMVSISPKPSLSMESMTKLLLPCFSGSTLQGNRLLDIQRCLYLPSHRAQESARKAVNSKNTAPPVYHTEPDFGFAEKQELLVKIL